MCLATFVTGKNYFFQNILLLLIFEKSEYFVEYKSEY